MNVKLKAANLKVCMLIFVLQFFLNNIKAQAASCDRKISYPCKGSVKCIPNSYHCNGIVDCPNKDDENNCDVAKCTDTEKFFKCRDDVCIAKDLICDGEADCPDASDEGDHCEKLGKDVLAAPIKQCDEDHEFKCKQNGVCIPKEDICNGVKNCADNSDEDEKFCKSYNFTCPGFTCSNGKCLSSHDFVCDGFADCEDNSDELHCALNCELSDSKFLCGDECIDLKKVCDQNKDCTDNSDEDGKCDQKNACDNFVCKDGTCKLLPTGPTCICAKGFSYNQESKKCEDINECDKYGICSQGCLNLEGSYNCTCAPNFFLDVDRKNCLSINGNVDLIYTTKDSIKSVNLDSRFHSKITDAKQPIGISSVGDILYYIDVQKEREIIATVNLTSKADKKILLTNGLELPEYISVDWLTKNIYFTDSRRKHIAVCTEDAYFCTELLKIEFLISQPRAIALHPIDSLMFWSDWGDHAHIGVSFMDGSDPKFLVSNLTWPNGLAVDWPNGRIYWIDAATSVIESVKINGQDRRVVLKDVFKHPYSLTVYESRLYWCDSATKTIEYCNKFTGKNHDILAQGSDYFDVYIHDKATMPTHITHACSENPCSHICLLSSNKTYSCACPTEMELEGKHKCRRSAKAYKIIMGIGPFIFESVYQSFGRHEKNEAKKNQLWFDRMEFDTLTGRIFYADNYEHKICYLDIDKNSFDLVTDHILQVTSLTFDYLGNNLYWADALKGTIEVISLTTKKRAILQHFGSDHKLAAIIAAPSIKELFVALKSSDHAHIDRLSINGGDMAQDDHLHFIESGLSQTGPFHFAIDEIAKRLYWSDARNNRIDSVNFDGTNRKLIFKSGSRAPGPIALIGNDLYWTSFESRTLQWREKNADGPLKKMKFDTPKELDTDFPHVFNIISGSPLKANDSHVCSHDNGGCSDICISDGFTSKTCKCGVGRDFKDKQKIDCVDRTKCDFRCSSGECIEASKKCNNVVDCLSKDDEDKEMCSKIECPIDEFKCEDNSKCIPKSQRCDSKVNCDDGSDEKNCPKEAEVNLCNDDQIVCPKTDKCIYITQICDMVKDCPDGFDETESVCKVPCTHGYFKCLSGQCIPQQFECDTRQDCVDGSDEHEECEQSCKEPKKPCRNGLCIDSELFCDGHKDCPDGFDEQNCRSSIPEMDSGKCDIAEFFCISSNICIPGTKRCDKVKDCPRGEDEMACPNCPRNLFECDNGECITTEKRCNGIKDCKDNSDESNCKPVSTKGVVCTPGTFKCSDGTCLDYSYVCNKEPDCDDDEGPMCDEPCGKSDCDQTCKETPKGHICLCRDGYELKGAGSKICQDIDECKISKTCSQKCVNTDGSFYCSCFEGFMQSFQQCKAYGNPKAIILAMNDQIRKITDTNLEILQRTDLSINDIAVNIGENILIFSFYGENGFTTLDMNKNVTNSLDVEYIPELIAYDWISENIYITHGIRTVSFSICNMKKSKCILIKRIANKLINSIDIDPISKWVFYVQKTKASTFISKSEIVKMTLDGSDSKIIYNDESIEAIAVDVHRKLIFFIEKHSQSLISIDYNGENKETIVHQSRFLQMPSALSVFENEAYVLDHLGMSVCKLYDDHLCRMLEMNTGGANKFVIQQQTKQPKAENSCKDHSCDEICIRMKNEKKCLCSNAGDIGKTCAEKKAAKLNESNGTENNENDSSHPFLWTFITLVIVMLFIGAIFIAYRKKRFHKNFNISMGFHGTELINEASPKPTKPSLFSQSTIASAPTINTMQRAYNEVFNNNTAFTNDYEAFKSCENMENFSDEELQNMNMEVDNDDPKQKLIV